MDDRLVCIAWAMHADDHGLGMEVDRRFLLIHEYVCFGMTNLDTGQLVWSVNKFATEDEARMNALDLTAISEQWGCTLTMVPHVRELRQAPRTTRVWLNSLLTPDMRLAGLDATFDRVLRQGNSLDPAWMGA
jgi:hypothetical protein